MGRSLKNKIIEHGEYSTRIPFGTTTQRPSSVKNGHFRYNTTTDALEAYINGNWRNLTVGGATTIVKDTFAGDGSTLVFGPMSATYTASEEIRVFVFVNNVHQNPGVAYTFDGTTNITFTGAVPDGHSIIVLHNFDSTTFTG